MGYTSIIRFLEYCHIDIAEESAINVTRIKKQINAEFAMQPDGIITIDDISYTKHDVLQEVEHPNFLERLQHHKTIWAHKDLLNTLEKHAIDIDIATSEWCRLQNDDNFVEFVSPYMAAPYDDIMKSLLKQPNFHYAQQWLSFSKFIKPEEEENAFKSIREYMEDANYLFRNINAKTYKSKLAEINPWQTQEWSYFINSLPNSINEYSEELALHLINFGVEVQKLEKKMCYQISRQLTQLSNISQDLKTLISNNHSIYRDNYVGTSTSSDSGSWGGLRVIVIAIVVILKIITASNGCNERRSYNYDTSNNIDINTIIEKRLKEEKSKKEEYFEKRNYEIRSAFVTTFKNKAHTQQQKNSIAVTKKLLYFLLQDNKQKSSMFPLFIYNNTSQIIVIQQIINATNNIAVMPNETFIFGKTPKDSIKDFVIEIGQREVYALEKHKKRKEVKNNFQYIHISNDNVVIKNSITFSGNKFVPLTMDVEAVKQQASNYIMLEEEGEKIKIVYNDSLYVLNHN